MHDTVGIIYQNRINNSNDEVHLNITSENIQSTSISLPEDSVRTGVKRRRTYIPENVDIVPHR